MLAAQGWKPGDTLGAENASHASHYTAASSSHVRVLLREDNMGIGAKKGKQDADKFGLDMFQGLLGRLNGKSEEVLAKEAGYRRDINLKEMVVKRFGGTTFVSGGYLVGDKIEKSLSVADNSSSTSDTAPARETKSKKRRRNEENEDSEGAPADTKAESSADDSAAKRQRRKEKKEKKRRQLEEEAQPVVEIVTEQEVEPEPRDDDVSMPPLNKKQRKAEKRAAKEAKRQAKQERKLNRRTDEPKDEAITHVSTTPVDSSDDENLNNHSSTTVLQRTAAVPRGRFALRSRYSQQKRMAGADAQSLKEIFMIKAGG